MRATIWVLVGFALVLLSTGVSGAVRECTCGLTEDDGDPRILGGGNVKSNKKYPFMVSLVTKIHVSTEIVREKMDGSEERDVYPSEVEILCGGTIGSEYDITTASHCLFNQRMIFRIPADIGRVKFNRGLLFRLHPHNPCAPVEHNHLCGIDGSSRRTGIRSYQRCMRDDIAVVQTKRPFRWSPSIRKVCFPKFVPKNVQHKALAIGWGLTEGGTRGEEKFVRPKALRSVALEVVPTPWCEARRKNFNVDREICTMSPDGEGPMKGDSGGPLVMPIELPNVKPRRFIQLGVVTFGKDGYDRVNWPDHYARIAHYCDWFERNSKAIKCVHVDKTSGTCLEVV